MDWIMDSKMNSSLMDICWRNRCKYILYINVYIYIYIVSSPDSYSQLEC